MGDRRTKRDLHGLDENGMVICNPRDREAAHRAEQESIATEQLEAVTCRKCLDRMTNEQSRGTRSQLPIRVATPDDVAAILQVRTSVKENHLDLAQLADRGITRTSLSQMLRSTHPGWCAEVEAKLAGFSMVDRARGTVFALFVRPEFESAGLGSALLEAALASLRAAGHTRASVTTEPDTRAFTFYSRRGWKHVSNTEDGEAQFEQAL